jgi:hypothetical protein
LRPNCVAAACPVFAARRFLQKPFAASLPQDSSRQSGLKRCAERKRGRKWFAALEFCGAREPRIDNTRFPNLA